MLNVFKDKSAGLVDIIKSQTSVDEIATWDFPAHKFEQQTGITDIAQTWQTPKGLTLAELGVSWRNRFRESATSDSAEFPNAQMLKEFAEIVRLNPQLKSLDCDLNEQGIMYHIILGVASGYNFDDIQWFLDQNQARIKQDEYIRSLSEEKLDKLFFEKFGITRDEAANLDFSNKTEETSFADWSAEERALGAKAKWITSPWTELKIREYAEAKTGIKFEQH